MAPPDNTLCSGTIFSKSQKKQLFAPSYQQQALKLQPEHSASFLARKKSLLTPIISLIYSALKPKLLNMAFNLAYYLCF